MAKSDENVNETEKPKLTFGGLIQLITTGAGAPGLGEYERTDENGRMFFSLDANNFVDSDGESIQAKAKFFEKGYVEGVDDDFVSDAPGFFSNLLSGGRLMREFEENLENKKAKKKK